MAVTQYNNLAEKGKLELERVVRVNASYRNPSNYFITFSATNMDSRVTGFYRAILQQNKDQSLVLGLLRDIVLDNTLAILSVTGEDAEKRLESVRKAVKEEKEYEDAINNASKILVPEDSRKLARLV